MNSDGEKKAVPVLSCCNNPKECLKLNFESTKDQSKEEFLNIRYKMQVKHSEYMQFSF